MSRVAIIAAMAGELKPLVRGWAHERRGGVEIWHWKFDEGEWVAACAGAGVDAATRAFAEVERDGTVAAVISVGWAGALSLTLEPGRVYGVSGVVDARTGERFTAEVDSHPSDEKQSPRLSSAPVRTELAGRAGLSLVTSPIVAGKAEKQRLSTAYHADLVDMEAAGLARLALMRGIPFYCFKGVSDGFADKLPDFNRFIRADGRFDLAAMVLFSILRPGYWPTLMRMGENSREASKRLRERLLDFLDGRGDIRQRNGYPNLKH